MLFINLQRNRNAGFKRVQIAVNVQEGDANEVELKY